MGSKSLKHNIRDYLILMVSLSGISYIYRFFRRKPLVRVLCFHDVPDQAWFEELMNLLVSRYHLLTPEDFHQQKFDKNKINLLLTFDDGYKSWVDNCLPVLTAKNLKGLFFINSGLLEVAEESEKASNYMRDNLLISPRKALTWEGAKKLVATGHTIGGHTVSHFNLAKLSLDEAVREVVEDKGLLESRLGINMQDFAYPFGTKKHITNELVAKLREIYPYQYSAVTGFVGQTQVPISRTLIDNGLQPGSFIRSIGGSYDIFSIIKNKFL